MPRRNAQRCMISLFMKFGETLTSKYQTIRQVNNCRVGELDVYVFV